MTESAQFSGEQLPPETSSPVSIYKALRRDGWIVILVLVNSLFAGTLSGQQPSASSTPLAAPSVSPPAAPVADATSAVVAKKTTAPLTIDQIRNNLPLAVADRFEFLRKQRKSTLEAIDETASQAKTLAASIAVVQNRKEALDSQELTSTVQSMSKERMEDDLQRAKADVEQAQQKLDSAKKAKPPSPAEITALESELRTKQILQSTIQDAIRRSEQQAAREEQAKAEHTAALKAVSDELSKLNEDRDKATRDQLSYQRLLGEIDDMVNQLFIASDATNSFKLKMSIILSALIAVVITGFFIIAWSDEEVKRKIFSNEAGIQFITMFAIVISVILFGIIGVLESKELSALLGGLSGYILGRKA